LRLAHAQRNEQLNDKLIAEDIYHDWIVTTAFYSAIHYIEHKLFPCTWLSKLVANLDEAHSAMPYSSRKSRHETRATLVKSHLYNLHVEYEFLRKQSQNARYVNYNVSPALAEKSKKCLTKIKTACIL
jgi:hypothetical protein